VTADLNLSINIGNASIREKHRLACFLGRDVDGNGNKFSKL